MTDVIGEFKTTEILGAFWGPQVLPGAARARTEESALFERGKRTSGVAAVVRMFLDRRRRCDKI